MRNGVAYALPTWEHRTADSGSSSSPSDELELFMTPVAKEGEKATFQQGTAQKARTGQVWLTNQVRDIHDWNLLPTTTAMDYKASGGGYNGQTNVTLTDAIVRGRGLLPTPRTSDTNGPERHGTGGPDLRTIASELLPTPRATDGTKGGPNQRGSSGDLMLPSAVQTLLPTPRATRGGSGTETMYSLGAERSDDNRPQGEVLLGTPRCSDGIQHDLRDPKVIDNARGRLEDQIAIMATNWGPYEPAIRRWEAVLSRPAPAPTELNSKGGHRLSPKFTEFMMGVPEGWICDADISRNDKLKAAGNGVVPQQAAAALRAMLAAFEEDR
jgi:hypothetical protein